MNKPFLLIAGDDFYPGEKTQDWIGCFATREEAESKINTSDYYGIKIYKIICDKWHHGKISEWSYDWVDIVDLRDWAE